MELEGTQNNDLLRELRSIVTGDSSGQQASEYLCDEPKQFFYAHSPDATAWYREQQEKRCIHISEIVQILRTTKVQQFRGKYYNDGKFCALAIMHEKYGWDRNYAFRYEFSHQQLVIMLRAYPKNGR